MRNTTIKVEGSTLVIRVNLSESLGLSKSGKSTLIASTEGNATVHTPSGEVKVGLNVYQPTK